MEAKEAKMESQMELRRKQRDPRWNSDGSRGIRDVIQDGAQMEAKEAKEAMESQMELRWSSDGVQMEFRRSSDGSEGSQDCLPRSSPSNPSNPSNPRGNPRHIKKTGHHWSVFKIYRELNDYSATTSNEKVPFTFL